MNARNGWVGAALYLSNSLMQASGRERCQWPGAREREGERMSGYDAAICVNAMPRAESKAATVESTCWHTHILYSTL